MQITTFPVYSKLADPAALPSEISRILPKGWQLSQHQLETYRALIDPNIDVVINTAMTGDGKSLAGLLPLLANNRPAMGLYPTNELAQDQLRNCLDLLPRWQGDPRDVTQISGPILDELLDETEDLTRGEMLLRELNNHPLVLSNPDLLHAITQFCYQQYGRATTHIVGRLSLLFDQLTFDEFHIFDVAQITAVLTGLLFLYEQAAHPFKTLFLSATPDQRLITPLQQLGFGERLRIITPQEQGWYAHGADPGAGWRQILYGSDIRFEPQSAEEWLEHGVEQVILPWFQTYGKGAKAAIIVNSVATALRVVARLQALLPENIRVAPNTGLNGRSTRKASYDAEILVGTSTVDVGVDFRINLLIFESSSAGTFMQRLGRLGRHAGYTDSAGAFHQFQHYQAVALVPQFIYERLTQPIESQPAKLQEGMLLQRDELNRLVSEGVFLNPTEFRHYPALWGRFQPAKVLRVLLQKPNRQSFMNVIENLTKRYKALTHTSMNKAQHDWNSYITDHEEDLVKEAQSFRGGGTFPCALLKPDEGEVLSYDLFWLLANARLELLDQPEFESSVKHLGLKLYPKWLKRQCFCFRWQGLLEQREYPVVQLTPKASTWGTERHHNAQILPGFTLIGSSQPWLNQLNDKLIGTRPVALLIPDYDPQQVRRQLYIVGQMPLFPYENAAITDPRSGTIAFGRAALLLDSLFRYRKPAESGGAIFC